MINLYWIASIWRQNELKWWVTSQNIQNYAKLRKWSNYNELHRFDVKTIYNDELRRKTFKTTQNYKSDIITMNCMHLTSKRTKMSSYVAKHSKLRKTTKVIKIQWLASIWRQNKQKLWVTSQNIQNYANIRKWSNYNELHRFDVKTSKNDELRRKTFKTTHNYESDQIIMNCIDLTSKRSTMMSYVAKHSKLRKTTKVIKL